MGKKVPPDEVERYAANGLEIERHVANTVLNKPFSHLQSEQGRNG